MRLKNFMFPANMKMELLSEILDEGTLWKLIIHFMDKSERTRMIRMPKRQTILKLLAFHYGSKVMRGETSWDEVMKSFKKEFDVLKNIGVSRKEFKRLFRQKFKEILKENK